MLVSRQEYARMRGVTEGAVRYQIRAGWIRPDGATGKIDTEQADRVWPLTHTRGRDPRTAGTGAAPDPAFGAALDVANEAGNFDRLAELLDMKDPLEGEQ
jgi:hypothetical protein